MLHGSPTAGLAPALYDQQEEGRQRVLPFSDLSRSSSFDPIRCTVQLVSDRPIKGSPATCCSPEILKSFDQQILSINSSALLQQNFDSLA